MLNLNNTKSGTCVAIAFLMGATAVSPLWNLTCATAQSLPAPRSPITTFNQVVIPAGTRIPVMYKESKKILVTSEETMPLTLKVAANITDRNGRILIPSGSEIVGQIEPAGKGSRFVAQGLTINKDQEYTLNATSQVVTKTETLKDGASASEILSGTLAGAGAATLISGLTGDRRIDALEVLAGAAVGTLAGWILPETGIIGGGSQDVISINPNKDLTLTMQSQLAVYSKPSNQTKPSWITFSAR